MSLTAAELKRIEDLEQQVTQLAKLVKGAGSKNQLNRLLVLAQEQTRQLSVLVETLEGRTNTLLELARRLQ